MTDSQSTEIFAYIVCFILGYMICSYFNTNDGFSIGAKKTRNPTQSCEADIDICRLKRGGGIAKNTTYKCPGTTCYDTQRCNNINSKQQIPITAQNGVRLSEWCGKCQDSKEWDGASSSCKTPACPAGEYIDEGVCNPCPAGKTSIKGGPCTPCPAGNFSRAGQGPQCTPCAPGKYSEAGQGPSCTLCPAGKTSKAEASECTDCPAGHISTSGASECTPCDPPLSANRAQTECIGACNGLPSKTGCVQDKNNANIWHNCVNGAIQGSSSDETTCNTAAAAAAAPAAAAASALRVRRTTAAVVAAGRS